MTPNLFHQFPIAFLFFTCNNHTFLFSKFWRFYTSDLDDTEGTAVPGLDSS